MKNYLLLIVFGLFFMGCKEQVSLKEYMVDSWQTTYIKIEMPTFQKSDSTTIYEDKFENNPLRIAQSQYKSDGTFTAWYLNPAGERLGDSPGSWTVKGDSLYIQYEYNGTLKKVAYHIKKTEEGFEGVSKYDWDEDGDFDDLLLMKTKRISLQ